MNCLAQQMALAVTAGLFTIEQAACIIALVEFHADGEYPDEHFKAYEELMMPVRQLRKL